MPLVTDDGFASAQERDWIEADAAAETPGEALAVHLPNDGDPNTLHAAFDRIEIIAIPFPAFGDGRGFSLAQRLRRLGYAGHLRARGHVIVDQYAYARHCGFDDVEIDDALAARQPEEQWRGATASALPPFRLKKAG